MMSQSRMTAPPPLRRDYQAMADNANKSPDVNDYSGLPTGHPPIVVTNAAARRMRLMSQLYIRLRRVPLLRRIVGSRPARSVGSAIVGRRLTRALWSDTPIVSFTVNQIRLTAPAHFVGLYIGREYERLLTHWLQSRLYPGMTAIDVGAHIGYLSIAMARAVGSEGRVLAVEPCSDNLRFLDQNIRDNHIGNIEVFPLAAGGQDGRRSFHVTGSSDSHGFYDHPLTTTRETVEVEVRRIDSLNAESVDLVKIDVEGAELDVLDGMTRVLSEGLSKLVVEWNPACQRAAGRSVSDLPRALTRLGFSLEALDDLRNRVLSVEQVLDEWSRGELDDAWYANIVAVR